LEGVYCGRRGGRKRDIGVPKEFLVEDLCGTAQNVDRRILYKNCRKVALLTAPEAFL
jgi:hypothetical protein